MSVMENMIEIGRGRSGAAPLSSVFITTPISLAI